ncbi:UDP-glucose 4-epimerase GalE [Artemisia annua]|uniref:UDP-glucose 4-epimerase GalE n=1 Tax=Artemisia annua TaxID=35608 RepID=A0A2U1LHP2_ARTAN|nr:UDP-glucose 4-epimerase GalE [Artemisia annua]
MACNLQYTIKEVKGIAENFYEVYELFSNASNLKEDLRKQYANCNDISPEIRAVIQEFFREEGWKDSKIKKMLGKCVPQIGDNISHKNHWMYKENTMGGSSSQPAEELVDEHGLTETRLYNLMRDEEALREVEEEQLKELEKLGPRKGVYKYQLIKELEKLGLRKGVIIQSVKYVVQSLMDNDLLVSKDKDRNLGAVKVLQDLFPEPGRLQFIYADLGDAKAVNKIFSENAFDAVMHFAAVAYVGESTLDPLKYYHNITSNTLVVLEAMAAHNVNTLIYSSTCATYGEPDKMPITEETPQNPINPYGKAKKMSEDIIQDFHKSSDMAVMILRYFNVIGSDPEGRLGEAPRPELREHGRISGACFDAARGITNGLKVRGTDYKTEDGTCIRDYIDVTDLVDAHVKALENAKPGHVGIYNVGTDKGVDHTEPTKKKGFARKIVLATCLIVLCIFMLKQSPAFRTPSPFSRQETGVTHVLVTGGAGYIGSHATLRLLKDSYRVTIVEIVKHGVRALENDNIGGDSNEYTDADFDDIREEWAIYVSNFIFR